MRVTRTIDDDDFHDLDVACKCFTYICVQIGRKNIFRRKKWKFIACCNCNSSNIIVYRGNDIFS